MGARGSSRPTDTAAAHRVSGDTATPEEEWLYMTARTSVYRVGVPGIRP